MTITNKTEISFNNKSNRCNEYMTMIVIGACKSF